METQGTQLDQHSAESRALYVGFELSSKRWVLASSDGRATSLRHVTIDAGDLDRLGDELGRARRRFGLPEDASVFSCYEAGRDGFWIHRTLESMGVSNVVVDSASIEVNRRKRRAKTDRLDARKLVAQLIRYHRGEDKVWQVVLVPGVDDEDARHLHREMDQLKKERRQHRCRIQSLLVCVGVDLKATRGFLKRLEQTRLWDGSDVPPGLKARVVREYRRLEDVDAQIREVETERKRLLEEARTKRIQMVRQLMLLKGIGIVSAWLFVMEFFGWRQFRNRRQVGGAAGLTGTPYDSGGKARDQGISKAGNARIRSTAVEIAWTWMRYQPHSKLTCWYQERYGGGSSRMRKVGTVAVARRLLVDLWRFLEYGAVPEGARLKV